ncbi:hypothetical protein V1478_001115 [Vespula squamosa]|uniref:Odorant receptor n=1 Tax=Vespula squamosa TaxID=30214 RepID=A0ABD2C7J9_VESSQ
MRIKQISAWFYLRCLLDNLLEVKEKNLNVVDDEIMCKRIIHIIKIHNRTIQYIYLFNENFDKVSFILMVCALCYIGIAVISILEIYNDFKNSSSGIESLSLPILYVIFHLIWIFVLCHIGQYLQNISETAFYKAYDTPWYLFSKQSKTLLSFFIARSYNPAYVSIGKIFQASHDLFTGKNGGVRYQSVRNYAKVIMDEWYMALSKTFPKIYSCAYSERQFNYLLLRSVITLLGADNERLENIIEFRRTRQWYRFLKTSIYFTVPVSYNSYVSLMFLSSLKPLLLDLMMPLNETRPYTLIIPMNWYTGQERHFLKILIFQLGLCMILGLCAISSFSIYILILQHICAMFHIIGCLLDNLSEVKEKNMKVIDDEIIRKRIIHVIKIHNRTIQSVSIIEYILLDRKIYINVFNKTFNVISLVLLVCALCFIGIAVISILEIFDEFKNSSSDIGSLSLPIFYVIFNLIWIFVLCHIGQHLQNISEKTFYKAYDTPWYLFPKQSKKLLSFFIVRSYKPVYISIGKMFVASHEFFTGLVRSSISYAMGLRMEEFEMTPFGFVQKICSISGIWPLLTPSQRRIGALLMSASLFIAYFVQLLRLLLEIMNDWSNIKKTKQFVVLLDYASLSRKCIFIYLQLIHVVDVPTVIKANSFGYVGLCVISSLSLYLIILQHICAMFQIIGISDNISVSFHLIVRCLLENIMDDKEKELKVINDEVIYSRMIHIIQIHKKTIEYSDVLNNHCNIRILVMTMCAICFIGIAIIPILELLNEDINKSNIGSFTLPIFFVICHLIWIFVFCTVGQHLQNLSEAIFYKSYEIPWYLFSKKTRRLLYFIIARADKPNYVSIGQMFMATHEFFTGVSGFLLLPYNTKLLLKFIIRISPTIYSFAGYTVLLIKRKKIKELFDQIHNDCELGLFRYQKSENIMKMYAENIKYFFLPLYAIYIWFIITLLIFLIEPFVTNKFLTINNERGIYKYPVSIGYYEKFQSHFFIIFVALCNIPITECIICVVLWTVFLHLTQHSCAMFCVTGYMFEHAFIENEKNKFEINKNTKIYEMFVRVIKYHNESIRYNYPWYTTPPKIQKMYLLILMKSTEPLYMSVGKVFNFSYELIISTFR